MFTTFTSQEYYLSSNLYISYLYKVQKALHTVEVNMYVHKTAELQSYAVRFLKSLLHHTTFAIDPFTLLNLWFLSSQLWPLPWVYSLLNISYY